MDSAATTIGYTNMHDFIEAQTPSVTIIPWELQPQPPIENTNKWKEKELAELTLQGYIPNTTHRTAQETGRYRVRRTPQSHSHKIASPEIRHRYRTDYMWCRRGIWAICQ